MKSILKAKTHQLCFNFYKSFIVASTIISIFLIISKVPTLAILLYKLILCVFAFFMYYEASLRKKLVFYYNFGISKIALFLYCFAIDSVITILLTKIIDVF